MRRREPRAVDAPQGRVDAALATVTHVLIQLDDDDERERFFFFFEDFFDLRVDVIEDRRYRSTSSTRRWRREAVAFAFHAVDAQVEEVLEEKEETVSFVVVV